MDKVLPPMFAYPGGKSNIVRKLLKYVPKHNVFVDATAGGNSMFFAKPLAKVNILNDKNKELMLFYDEIRRGGLRNCKVPNTKETFERSKICSSTCCKFARKVLSFLGKEKHYLRRDRKYVGTKALSNLKDYEKKLRKATLSFKDFKDVLDKYDSPQTFVFIDPPYYQEYYTNKSYKHKKEMPLERVFDEVNNRRSKILITYNIHPEVIKKFRSNPKWYLYKIRSRGNTGNRTGSMEKETLIIANWRIK